VDSERARTGGAPPRRRPLRAAALAGAAGLGSLAIASRLGAARPLLAATLANLVVFWSLGVGFMLQLRHHRRHTRWGLTMVGAAVAALAAHRLWAAASGATTTGRSAVDEVVVVLAGAAIVMGLVRLLATRGAGRAIDALLEGTMAAAAVSFLASAAAVSGGSGAVSSVRATVPLATWIVALWLAGRCVRLASGQIPAYRYLTLGLVALVVVEAALAGAKLDDAAISRAALDGVALWACVVCAFALRHRTMRRSLPLVEARPARFGGTQLAATFGVAILAPSALLAMGATRDPSRFGVLVAGSAALPVLLATYLVRQIRDRARAEYRAQHDALTGLPNRTLFEDRAQAAFSRARRADTNVAVMFLDLDRFKAINDTLGHPVGNQLLQAVAARLRSTVRECDTIARMGGDEFAVLVADVEDQEDVATVASKLLDVFSAPFAAGDRELHTSTSIGIAMFPDDGTDVDGLIKNADIAMYRVKARGRDNFGFYTADMSTRAHTKLSVESGLRHALDRGQLELHYQPQIDVAANRIVGLEALARWPHPRVGMLAPDVFVPIAEESGLIVPLGEWALEEACFQARRWLDLGVEVPPIAVNISARQFAQAGFVEKVARLLEQHRIPPNVLEFEITESIFMRNFERASAAVERLRALGVRGSIDDFGTGFSGLGYLADMPIDSLKIDRSFVARLRRAHDHAPIIEAIIGLARGLGLNIIAEGVESPEQVEFLLAHGCTRMQGYGFSPALTPDDMTALLMRDEDGAIEWRTVIAEAASPLATAIADCEPTSTSQILAAVCGCGDDRIDVDATELLALIDALVPGELRLKPQSPVRAASMRVAAGTVAGLIPLSTGLAAANALPDPFQQFVAGASRVVGFAPPLAVAGSPVALPPADGPVLPPRAGVTTNTSVDALPALAAAPTGPGATVPSVPVKPPAADADAPAADGDSPAKPDGPGPGDAAPGRSGAAPGRATGPDGTPPGHAHDAGPPEHAAGASKGREKSEPARPKRRPVSPRNLR
jgi:diguanylate cyclase (GGDEF)-like protein